MEREAGPARPSEPPAGAEPQPLDAEGPAADGGSWADEAALCADVVETARAATGARRVCLTEAGAGRVRRVAQSEFGNAAAREAVEAVRSLVPEFGAASSGWSAPDANPLTERLYLRGEAVAAPVSDLDAGVVDGRHLRVAAAAAGLRHAFAVPVRVEGAVAGALLFYFAQPVSAGRRRVCEACARQAGLTLENARMLRRLRAEAEQLQRSRALVLAAEDRLREDIAERLHGRVQSRLIVAWHRLDDCGRHIGSDPAAARGILEEVRADLLDIQERDVRQASRRLHPAVIRLGLVTAVGALVDEFAAHLPVTLDIDPRLRAREDKGRGWLPAVSCLALYRAVEEGLGNAARHASATGVRLRLEMAPDGARVRAVVADDGRGLDGPGVSPGLGLSAIAARVEQAGGVWTLTGAPGRGAVLTVEVPVPLPQAPGAGPALGEVPAAPAPRRTRGRAAAAALRA